MIIITIGINAHTITIGKNNLPKPLPQPKAMKTDSNKMNEKRTKQMFFN